MTFEQELIDALENGNADAGIGVVYTGVTLDELTSVPVDYEFILSSDSTDGVNYTIEVDSEPTKVTDNADDRMQSESGDTVEQTDDGTWLIDGQTGSASGDQAYGDTFSWTSEGNNYGIVGFNATLPSSEFTVELNGTVVDPVDLPSYDDSDDGSGDDGDGGTVDGGDVIGGGSGYTNTVSSGDHTASTPGELGTALSNAASGDVVFIDSQMDIGTTDYTIPDGVTVAGDRGVDGSSGPLVVSGGSNGFLMGEGSRLTGIRLIGPWVDSGGDYGWPLSVDGVTAEIDNCEIAGFGEAGIYVENGGDCHLHHSYTHDTNRGGTGYGINVAPNSSATVERNYMENHRHCIAANGNMDGYDFRYNHIAPTQTDENIDIHGQDGNGGVTSNINNNIVEFFESGESNVQVRGEPVDACYVYDNWFYNPNPPSGCTSWCGDAVIQPNTDGFSNVHFTSDGSSGDTNNYGSGALSSFDQVIDNHPGSWHRPWDNSSPPDDGDDGGSSTIALGGGDGYEAVVPQSEADYTVTTESELSTELGNASSGEVVYVTGDITINNGDHDVPDGVTVAGDRGINGSDGPVLDVSGHPISALTGAGGRITGLQIRGPHPDAVGTDIHDSAACGVWIPDNASEVDNCEIYGFDNASVFVDGASAESHIHHNEIHDTNTAGLGYGVVTYHGASNPLIEHNYFWMNRHSVAAADDSGGYKCRHNHFGPSPSGGGSAQGHVIDVHDPAPGEFYIEDNIVTETDIDSVSTGNTQLVYITGNWFWTDYDLAFESDTDDYANISDNYFGENQPISFSDIIPGHPGASDTPW